MSENDVNKLLREERREQREGDRVTGFVDRSDAKGEKERTAKGCSSASSPSNLTSLIFHLVTEWNASSTSVAFCRARLAASPDECATQGQRPPRKSGQPNSLAASSCPMTEVRNEGSLSGDKLISLVLLPCPQALFQLTGFVDMQLRQERLGQV